MSVVSLRGFLGRSVVPSLWRQMSSAATSAVAPELTQTLDSDESSDEAVVKKTAPLPVGTIGVDKVVALRGEVLTAADLLKWYHVPSSEIKATFPRGVAGDMKKCYFFKNTPAFMVRKGTLDGLSLLRYSTLESSKKNSSISRPGALLTGPVGAGKSAILNQMVHFCNSNGWLTMFIPQASYVTDVGGNFSVQKTLPDGSDIYYLPDVAQEMFRVIKDMHADKLATIPLRCAESKAVVSDGGDTLLGLVEMGIKSWDRAGPAMEALFDELKVVTEFPVLVAVDEVDSFQRVTRLRSLDNKPLMPGQLSIVRHFVNPTQLGKELRNGMVVCAVAGSAPPQSVVRDEGPNGLTKLHVPRYTKEETASVVGFHQASGHILDEMSAALGSVHVLSSGAGRELNRVLLSPL